MNCLFNYKMVNLLMCRIRLTVFLSLALICGLACAPDLSVAAQGSLLTGSHGDNSIMPKSCRACHKGMSIGLSGEEDSCLDCHSDESRRLVAISKGALDGNTGRYTLKDITAELRKTYNHPVLTVRGAHRYAEELPEMVVNAVRHSECVDCHNPHAVEVGAPYRGLMGHREGNFITEIEEEFELCYRCHSDSANMPGRSTNKHAEFKTTNPSFHPVEGEGRSARVPSLKEPYVGVAERPGDISRISCRDCHGSDDPAGPAGPHGSNYPGLLVLNYQMSDQVHENEYAYALCYKCHERTSILSDESFPYHSLHIRGRGGAGFDGTSCITCHDAHGSTEYTSLIRFDERFVMYNANDELKYESQGVSARRGSCSLNCHGVEHVSKEY